MPTYVLKKIAKSGKFFLNNNSSVFIKFLSSFVKYKLSNDTQSLI